MPEKCETQEAMALRLADDSGRTLDVTVVVALELQATGPPLPTLVTHAIVGDHDRMSEYSTCLE